jgi:cytochrome c556
MKRALSLAIAAIVTCAALGTALAQSPSDRVIKYRQDVLGAMGFNFGAMGQMAQGRRPFDAAEFKRRAEWVSALAQLMDVNEMFPATSDEGAVTDAKADIWENLADFTAKMNDMKLASNELARIAKAGDEAAMKKQFGKTGSTCKACHDEYKAE